jgi:hypothetical protein
VPNRVLITRCHVSSPALWWFPLSVILTRSPFPREQTIRTAYNHQLEPKTIISRASVPISNTRISHDDDLFLCFVLLHTSRTSVSPKRICTANRPDLKVHTARKYHCGEQGLRYTHVRMTTLTIPFAMPLAPTPLLICFLASAAPLGSARRYHPAPRSVIFLLVPMLIP